MAFMAVMALMTLTRLDPAGGASPAYAQSPPADAILTGEASAASENVMIILDASYSMTERLADGESKMMAAKRTLWSLLRQLPPNVNVGLRVYGTSQNSFTACRATQVLAPIAAGNRSAIANQIIPVQPVGVTPITYTLQRSLAEDFVGLSGRKRIILVSDGLENCSADPCQVAVAMARGGVDVKIDVVGFGLQGLEAGNQLRCIALSTFGKYYTANTAAELARSMGEALRINASVEGKVMTPTKTPPPPASVMTASPIAPAAPARARSRTKRPVRAPAPLMKEYDAGRPSR
ncbi:MAG: VWA domain-containing protein [Vampirovibrionales bacterium]|nr:VWA domain-containing protein [Vampirovibrionales bacterium]